jgi:hypothetical protein
LAGGLGNDNAVARHFLSSLVTTDPAAARFVNTMSEDDPIAQDFINKLRGQHSGARLGNDGVDIADFFSELGNTADDITKYVSLIRETDSLALNVVAGLSANSLRGAAVGTWKLGGPQYACGYVVELGKIQEKTNFAKLKQKYGAEFNGNYSHPKAQTKNDTSVQAVTKMFTNIGHAASQTLVDGLKSQDTEAMFKNLIRPYDSRRNYTDKNDRVVYVCQNFRRDRKG